MKRTVIAIKKRISQKLSDSIAKQTVHTVFFEYADLASLRKDLSEIDAADYIFFMDGEDYMSVDCVRLISDTAEESTSDIIFADMLCYDGEAEYYYNLEPARLESIFSGGKKPAELYADFGNRTVCWRDLRGKAVSYELLCSVIDRILGSEEYRTSNDAYKKEAWTVKTPEIHGSSYTGEDLLTQMVFNEACNHVRAEDAFCFLYDSRDDDKKEYFESIVTPIGDDFYRYESLKTMIISEDIDLVSFDVFDTFIVRDVLEPVDVFRLLDREFNSLIGSADFISFSELRRGCEAACRARFSVTHPEYEDIDLDEIYDEIAERTVFSKDTLERMKALEIAVEHKVCKRRRCGYELYRLAVESGKQIIFVSDMYLHRQTVEDILIENGYDNYSALYISSEIRKCKWTGNLFEYIKGSRPDVDPGRILHLGDSQLADVESASKAGIKGELLRSGISRFYPELIDLMYRPDGMIIDKRSAVDLYPGVRQMLALTVRRFYDNPVLKWNKETDFNADPYLIGYFHLGMNLYGLIRWLIDESKSGGYSRIHFLSRDGYLPYEAYKIYTSGMGDVPEALYTFMSRKAVLFGNMRSCADIYSFLEGVDILSYSPEKLVEHFSSVIPVETKERAASFAENIGIDYCDAFKDSTDADLFIKILAEEMIDFSRLDYVRSTTVEYLSSVFRKGDCIFDAGYSGRVETALKECLGYTVDSFYLHRFKEISYEREMMKGFKIRSYYDFQPVVSFYVRELLFSGTGKRFDGVERDAEGNIKLLFSDTKMSVESKWLVETLQAGALQFIRDMKDVEDRFAGNICFRKMDAALPLEYFLHKGKTLDRAVFSCVRFEDDFGGNRMYDMTKEWQRDINERVGRAEAEEIGELRARLDDANWRLSETRKSFSYKLGLALTALPRWVRGRQ